VTLVASPRDRAVYDWEARVVRCAGDQRISVEVADGIVRYVYGELGVPHPPTARMAVDRWERDKYAGAWAVSEPTAIVFVHQPTTSVVLHEIAHALTENPLDTIEKRKLVETETHGDVWLSNYVGLLGKLMGPRYNRPYLMSTLQGLPVAPQWHMTVRGRVVRW
jgi:hypothetical protein